MRRRIAKRISLTPFPLSYMISSHFNGCGRCVVWLRKLRSLHFPLLRNRQPTCISISLARYASTIQFMNLTTVYMISHLEVESNFLFYRAIENACPMLLVVLCQSAPSFIFTWSYREAWDIFQLITEICWELNFSISTGFEDSYSISRNNSLDHPTVPVSFEPDQDLEFTDFSSFWEWEENLIFTTKIRLQLRSHQIEFL
jgi:hypothetical protein